MKKKLLLLMLSMLAGVSMTKADNVSIFPTGYTFTDNLPSDCNYRYSMTQQIYTQEELGAANTFTGISFWNSLDMSKTRSLSDREERVFEVYLLHTDKSRFDDSRGWIPVSPSDRMFCGEVKLGISGLVNVNFIRPFRYDGTSNLAVVVVDRSGYEAPNHTYFANYYTESTQAISAAGNDIYFMPTAPSGHIGSLSVQKNCIILTTTDATDVVVIGSNATSKAYLPVNRSYDHTLSQQIYTADEVGGAKELTSVSFFNASYSLTDNIDIYLVETEKSNFTASGVDGWGYEITDEYFDFSEGDKVFSGNVTFFEQDWTTIVFDRPFSYDGTKNLVLIVDNNGITSDRNTSFMTFSTPTKQAIFSCRSGAENDINADNLSSIDRLMLDYKNQIMFNQQESGPAFPSNIGISDLSPTKATIAWESEGSKWNLRYRKEYKASWDPWITINGITEKSYELTGLDANQLYRVNVQTVADDGTFSKWIPTEFTTPEAVPADFTASVTHNSATISWIGFNESYKVKYREALNSLFFDDFEKNIEDWTIINHGEFGWRWNSHEVNSSSYDAYWDKAVLADNWLITPMVDLQGILAYMEESASSGSSLEEYEVLLSTTGNEEKDFTTVLRPLQSALSKSRTQVIIDLSAYKGQQGYIAIHHYSNNGGALIIDDFGIYKGETIVPAGEWQTIETTANEITISDLKPDTKYDYQVIGIDGGEENFVSDIYSFTTKEINQRPAISYINASPTKAEIAWTGNSDSYKVQYQVAPEGEDKEVTIFEDDFESGLEAKGWTVLALGEVPEGHEGWETRWDTSCHSGEYMVWSNSFYKGLGAFNANNYLITPQLDLQGKLTFWVRSFDTDYHDHFNVLLSTTGKAAEDFTETLLTTQEAAYAWSQVVIDLSAYKGQQGYIAIHHQDADEDKLCIDDVSIVATETAPLGEWTTVETTETSIKLEGLEMGTKYICQVVGVKEGLEDATSEIASFTTRVSVDLVLDAEADNGMAIGGCDGSYANVVIKNLTLKKDGRWQGICLPFDVELEGSILEGADLRTVENAWERGPYIILDCLNPLTKLEAGVPYLIKWDSGDDIVEPTFSDVLVQYYTRNVSLYDNKIVFLSTFYAASTTDDYYYQPEGTTRLTRVCLQPGGAIYAFNTYFRVDMGLNATKEGFGLNFGDLEETITGIRSIEDGSGMMEDGNIYNLAGQRLSKPQHGINIIGGKKIIRE